MPINFNPQTTNGYGAPLQDDATENWFQRLRNQAVNNPNPNSEAAQKKQLVAASGAAGNFAGQGEQGYGSLTGDLNGARQFWNDTMMGRNSIATEQLRQGLQQQQAAQQSMAAGASPANSAMAARNAAMGMGRNQAAMTGQAAQAQLAERQMAADQYGKLSLGQRDQDVNVALGSRQNQMTGLGANKPAAPAQPGTWQKIAGGAALAAGLFSDERLKTDVKDGDSVSRKALDSLSAHTYRYKDPKYGAGDQLGVMAQALERAGLKQAVVDTPEGKAIDHAKLTGANTAMLAAVAKRVSKLETKK